VYIVSVPVTDPIKSNRKTQPVIRLVTTDDILIPADLSTRVNHPYKFRTIRANTTIHRHSFFMNTIPAWNSLQDETAKSMTAETFKSHLKSEHRQ